MDFVFSDATAMNTVRFQHFVRDYRCIAGDPAKVDNLIEQEKRLALGFLANLMRQLFVTTKKKWRARRDSNSRPPGS